MKRLIICTLLSLLTAVSIQAARALSIPFEVTQPDGTTLTIILYGDEYCNWLTTSDGTMLVENNKVYYVAAIGDNGELKATKQLAHNANLRPATEEQLCLQQQARQALFFSKAEQLVQAGRRAQIDVGEYPYFPHMNEPKTLVILANFSDLSFVTENAHDTFNQLCNAETLPKYSEKYNNLCSVRRYFQQCSHGKFNPQLDVIGPVTLPQTMEYYGKSAEGSSTDANFYQFCKDAIAAVEDEVDFNDYDNDGDGKAELGCVIYAGYGQNISGNPKNSIWPKCGYQGITTSDAYKENPSKKVTVSYMNCGAELMHVSLGNEMNGLGTFIHEFSHGMGLADHYANNTNARIDNQTPEYWDLMDYGEHFDGKDSHSPFDYFKVYGMLNLSGNDPTFTRIDIKGRIATKQFNTGKGWSHDLGMYHVYKYIDNYGDKKSQRPGDYALLNEACSFAAGLYSEKVWPTVAFSNDFMLDAIGFGGTTADYYKVRRYNFASGFSLSNDARFCINNKFVVGYEFYFARLFSFKGSKVGDPTDRDKWAWGDKGNHSVFMTHTYMNIFLKHDLKLNLEHQLYYRRSNYECYEHVHAKSHELKVGLIYSI